MEARAFVGSTLTQFESLASFLSAPVDDCSAVSCVALLVWIAKTGIANDGATNAKDAIRIVVEIFILGQLCRTRTIEIRTLSHLSLANYRACVNANLSRQVIDCSLK